VNIHLTASGSIVWCSAQVIEANSNVPDGTNFPLRTTAQSPSDNPVSNAISVSELLTLAGLDASTVNHTEILRLGGTWSMLDNADLVAPSAQFQGGLTPIFWINGSETQYLRPLRGPSDTNGDDQIVASAGSPLDLYVYSGPLLTVAGNATPSRAAVKQPVTFTARVSNPAPADGALVYKWNFQDGTTATGASVTHTYAVAGSWYPVVTVQGEGNDSGGASQPIRVTVGPVPKGGSSRTPGGTHDNKHAHAGGPTHSKGNTANTAPTTRRTSGSSTQTRSKTRTAPTRSAAHMPGANPHRAPGAHVVQGRLIADVIPVSAAQLATERNPVHAPSAGLGGGSLTPLAAIAGGFVIVLLLGSGAAAELRSQRRSTKAARTA
jgi:hypothetical protein